MIFLKILEKKNPSKKNKILIVFDESIADRLSNSNKKIQHIVTYLFIKGRNLSLILLYQKY